MTTEAMVPMAGLAAEWAVNANTVSRRLKHLGIKPERQGNLRFITAEQKALGDQLQDLANKISRLQKEIEDRAGNLLDERDRMIHQRLWLQNELDNVGAG